MIEFKILKWVMLKNSNIKNTTLKRYNNSEKLINFKKEIDKKY
jgi:hypothetical protein